MSDYANAGVNIDAGNEAVRLMKEAVRRTYTSAVLSDTGSFGGLFSLKGISSMTEPVLVASTDGVGTKTKVASRLNRWDTIGQDLVNHCVNDILVQGAQPLFFMDYVASSKLIPQQIADIVKGMAQACEALGIALLGGETAEMPGVYVEGEVDVAGTIVGVVNRANLIDGKLITIGDKILNMPSSGLHTNGFSLARKVLDGLDWTQHIPELNNTIGEALLAVHRPYFHEFHALINAGIDVKGMAHITGGGVVENLPRILPKGVNSHIETGSWHIPPIFTLIQQRGEIAEAEMMRVFNMGLGMLVVLPSEQAEHAASLIDGASIVGTVIADE